MSRHLVILVHGIRTFGQWQDRLAGMIAAANPSIRIRRHKYGYFSAFAFILPLARLVETLRLRRELARLKRADWDRIDIVAHSFGTHIVGHALRGMNPLQRPEIHTVILAGSVLRPTFPWNDLIGHGVHRVVNECGTRDSVLLLSHFFAFVPPFTGMAGRVGFYGFTGDQLVNRFHPFSHSEYFLPNENPDREFMRAQWLPLIASDAPAAEIDDRPLTWRRGLWTFVENSATPFKLAIVVGLLLLPWWYYRSLYLQTARQLVDTLIARGQTEETAGHVARARGFYADARRTLQEIGDHTMAADLALYRAYSGLPAPLQQSNPHTSFVDRIAVAPDGRTAASVGSDRVAIWDLLTGVPVRQLDACGPRFTAVAFAHGSDRVVVSPAHGRSLIACDVTSGTPLWSVSSLSSNVTVLAASRDGSRIAAGGEDGTVGVADAVSGTWQPLPRGDPSAVTALALSPDGRRILSAGRNGQVTLWEIEARSGRVLSDPLDDAAAVAFVADQNLAIAASGSTLAVWDLASGRRIGSSPIPVSLDMPNDRPVLSADGASLLASMRESVMLAPTEQDRLDELTLFSVYLDRARSKGSTLPIVDKIWSLSNHATSARDAVFPPGSNALVLTTDNRVEVWDAARRSEPRRLPFGGSFQSSGLSADGLLVVARGKDDHAGVFDVWTMTELRALTSARAGIGSIALDASGTLAAIGTSGGVIELWDIVSGRKLAALEGHSREIVALTMAPDGSQLYAADASGAMDVWSLPAGKRLHGLTGTNPSVSGAAYSADSATIATGGDKKEISLWDARTGRLARTLAPGPPPESIVFSGDGSQLLTATNGTLRVIDARTGSERVSIPASRGRSGAAYLSDPRWAVSAGIDRSVKFWDLQSKRILAAFPILFEGWANIHVAGGGVRVWTSSAYEQNLLWSLDAGVVQEEHIDALTRARQALRQNPADAGAMNTLARWYAFRGRCEWAAILFEKTAPAASAPGQLDRFRCFATTGRSDLARAELQRLERDRATSPAFISLWRQALVVRRK